MRRLSLLCVIGVGLWSFAPARSQPTQSGALPGALRAHVQGEPFQIVTSVRGLPLGVRNRLQGLFSSRTLEIADPGGAFRTGQADDDPTLPSRRLVAAGCSTDHCLVYYERVGIEHRWHVALFHWTPDATRLEGGGTAPPGLTTLDAVRRAILAEDITASDW